MTYDNMILLYQLIWEYMVPFLGGRIQLPHDSVFSFFSYSYWI
jgi:hypothetical protein